MPVSRLIVISALLAALGVPVRAAEAPLHPAQRACLTKAEQRAAVGDHKAIPLAKAIKILHAHGKHGEIVRARLCRRDEQLVYVLTLLSHNGKVTRTSVDAANGTLLVNTRGAER
jgi:uncharacterized membrane protein YkoI